MAMNDSQRRTVRIGLFVILLMALFPPWRHDGYRLIFFANGESLDS